MNDKLKTALLKQDACPNPYVRPLTEHSPAAILFFSTGRVAPTGLKAGPGADSCIIREEPRRETQFYRKAVPHIANDVRRRKTEAPARLPGQSFKQPGRPYPDGRFSADGRTMNWSEHDIVASIHAVPPTEVAPQCPDTLYTYMIGCP